MVYFLIFSGITPFHLIEYMSGAMLKVAGDMRRPSMMAILMVRVGRYFQLLLDIPYTYYLTLRDRTDDARLWCWCCWCGPR